MAHQDDPHDDSALPTRYTSLSNWLYTVQQTRLYQACSAAGITPTQFFALTAIEELGEPKMSALAQHLGLTPGGASTLLGRLVDNGQVERLPDSQDRRCVHIRMSESGRSALHTVRQRRQDQALQTFLRLSPEAREYLTKGLTALKAVWQTEETQP